MEVIAYLVSVLAVLAVIGDWAQTACLVSAPHLFEVNPILGPRPKSLRLHVYFGMSTFLVVAILCIFLLNEQFGLATGLAGFVAATELSCIVNNWAVSRVRGASWTCSGTNSETRQIEEADRRNERQEVS